MSQVDLGADFTLHHTGIYVENLNEIVSEDEIIVDEIQGVRLSFVMLGNTRIELLQPLNEKSPIYRAGKEKNKLLHLCFEVDDLPKGIETCRFQNFTLLRTPVEATAFPNKKIAWMYHKTFGLVELVG